MTVDEVKSVTNDLTPAFGHPSPPGRGEDILAGQLCFLLVSLSMECRMAYTILIVDDSQTIRSMLERSLTMTGLPIDAVIQAQHGREALDILAAMWVDIVFTDIHMPELDGIGLITAMQASKEFKDIPIVVVSTEGSASRISELTRKGIKGYLRKPFTPEKIRDVIVSTLGVWNA
jgi:two-component system, chemotaxis family, chemotaxis protein CheY